jgi:hypothetical protein
MRAIQLTVTVFALALLFGCTTHGNFVLPPGTELEIYSRPVTPDASGRVVMRPFGFNAGGSPPYGGVRYRLLKKGVAVQEGRLRVVFRGVSLFWPPFSVLYGYAFGLNPHITYDLVKGTQE